MPSQPPPAISPAAFEPELLRTFVAVCGLGSLNRAARQAGRATSAISAQIRRLEDMVGKRLFQRTGRGVVATAEGEIFLNYARRILALSDEAAQRLADSAPMGTLRLGVGEDAAAAALPRALGHFRRRYPALHLDIVVEHGPGLARLWQEGALDVAVSSAASFAAEPEQAWDVDILWVCGPGGAPAADRPLEVIVYPEPCVWRRQMFELLGSVGRDFRVVMTSPNIAAIAAAVEQDLGVALLMREAVRPDRMQVFSPDPRLGTSFKVQYGLYARHRLRPGVQAGVAVLRDTLQEMARPAGA